MGTARKDEEALEGFTEKERIGGWLVGFDLAYPHILAVACGRCGHLSIRDREQIPGHVCPGCGLKGSQIPVAPDGNHGLG